MKTSTLSAVFASLALSACALPYDVRTATPDATRTVSQPPVVYNAETAIDPKSPAVMMQEAAPVPSPTGVEAQPYKAAPVSKAPAAKQVKRPVQKGCK